MERIRVSNGDITLDIRAAGPEDGEVIILLHGFPECWATWRHQIQPLAAAGYRVLVPDMRGYGESSKPRGYRRYHLDELITDIDAIRSHSGRQQCHLAGHDWGAAVAWWYAIHYPQALISLAIVNVPHPQAFLETLRSSPRQLLKSWYIFFFQLPWLPEWLLRLNNFAILRHMLRSTSSSAAYQDEDFDFLSHSWRQPGTIKAMVNYYRAMLRHQRQPDQPEIAVPTRILWGEQDIALSLPMARKSLDYLTHGELITYPDGSHWLAHDKPREVAVRIMEHISHSQTAT